MAERNLDFDTVVDRKNTGCVKYDLAAEMGFPCGSQIWILRHPPMCRMR